jgi:hypothetical protein
MASSHPAIPCWNREPPYTCSAAAAGQQVNRPQSVELPRTQSPCVHLRLGAVTEVQYEDTFGRNAKGVIYSVQRRTTTPEETAELRAIRELIDAYAQCADRRDANGQMALFTRRFMSS